MTTEVARSNDTMPNPDKYTPDFLQRFSAAVEKPPIKDVLFESLTKRTALFEAVLKAADAECLKEEICEHGLHHAMRVLQNAFFLKDILLGAGVRGMQDTLFDDPVLAFYILTHDTGYGMEDLQWQTKYALNYHERSAAFLDELARRVPGADSANVFRQYYPIYRAAVLREAKDIFTPNSASKEPREYSPEDLLIFIHDIANYLEFFRAKRLEGLPEPHTYGENRYYWLTKKVSDYELTSDENTVSYSLVFDTDVVIPELPNFATWYQQAQQEVPVMWQLVQAFEELTGKTFVCQAVDTSLE